MSVGKYLGIDIGTTSIKAAVFTRSGEKLAQKNVDYTLATDSKTDFIEFDAEKYISLCNIIPALGRGINSRRRRFHKIGIKNLHASVEFGNKTRYTSV